jgi:hypothetical protein
VNVSIKTVTLLFCGGPRVTTPIFSILHVALAGFEYLSLFKNILMSPTSTFDPTIHCAANVYSLHPAQDKHWESVFEYTATDFSHIYSKSPLKIALQLDATRKLVVTITYSFQCCVPLLQGFVSSWITIHVSLRLNKDNH